MLNLFRKEVHDTPIYEYKTTQGKRYYVKCGNHTLRGFRTKREAKQAERELKKKILLEEAETEEPEGLYFSQVAMEYLNSISSMSEVKPGTIRKRKNMIDRAILPSIKDKPIDKITKKDCMIFRAKIKALDYSTSQKNQILQTYKAIFKYAKVYLDLTNDPTFVIESFKKTFDDKMKKKEKDNHMWSVEDFNQFIQYVDTEIYQAFFTLLFFTGMRLGEIQALQWKDFDGHSVYIYKAFSKECGAHHLQLSTPKTVNSVRHIELGEELSLYLQKFKLSRRNQKGFSEEWFIFGDEKCLSRTTIARHKDIAIKKAGVPRMTLHEFRHAHASNLIANGANIVSVSHRLGHSSVSITLDTYTHLSNQNDTDLLDRLGFK